MHSFHSKTTTIHCFSTHISSTSLKWMFALVLLFVLSTNIQAQEYATDRLFMKDFKKTKCKADVEKLILQKKTERNLSAEQEKYINQQIWNKIKVNLDLSPGQKYRLKNFSYVKTGPKLSSKQRWAQRAKKFRAMRQECK